MKWLRVALMAGLVAGCGGDTDAPAPATSETPEEDSTAEVVLYTAFEDGQSLSRTFERWTAASGIYVTIRDGAPGEIVAAVIEDAGAPPADVLFTRDVYGAWLAAEEGALRPLGNGVDISAVPEALTDPDGYWVAAGARFMAIAWRPADVGTSPPGDYAALADAAWRGKLCLASSRTADSRALIAMLIDALGERAAELVVRGWVSNLALPPYDSRDDLEAALEAGTCGAAILSVRAGHSAEGDGDVRLHVPARAFGNIDVLGVARHARSPEAARSLIDWYLREQAVLPEEPEFAIRNVGIAGALGEDARLLAERAGYR